MQIAVISGKGGTGKTTVAVGIAETIKNSIKVDCDVDASNMNLFYQGKTIFKEKFYSGKTAFINQDICLRCNQCQDNCQFEAIDNYLVNINKCEGCLVCKLVCPVEAISFEDNYIADIIIQRLNNGTLIKADMKIGADGSGRLITALRKKVINKKEITIIDASPGIGCPVIASITNVDLALIVTEPSLSALEDLKRIVLLTKQLKVKALVCINKYNLNLKVTEKIKSYCYKNNLEILSLIPYDKLVLKSINELKPIVVYKDSIAGLKIKELTKELIKILKNTAEEEVDKE